MHSIHDIIDKINDHLKSIEQVEAFGVAQTIATADDRKMPAIVRRDGEADYVGIDDVHSISLYHKLNSVTVSVDKDKGFGRSDGAVVNSYSNSMIVFLNRKMVNLFADELMCIIQALLPETITMEPYSQIKVRINNAILNDTQVFSQEYSGEEFQLGPEHNLFQINYSVEATFLKSCFNTCSKD